MFKIYLKIAYRSLLKNRLFTAINTTGLALGMSAAILIFLWVQNELNFDNHHADADRIHRVITHLDVGNEIWDWWTTPLSFAEIAAEEIPEIDQLTKFRRRHSTNLKTGTGQLFKEISFGYIDENWFNLFDYDVLAGSVNQFNENIYSLALTASKAQKLFGYEAALGQTVYIDSVGYTVNMILADNPANTVLTFDGFMPLAAHLSVANNADDDKSWGNFNYLTFVKLKGNAPMKVVEEKMVAILDEYRTSETQQNNAAVSLEALSDIRFSETVTDDIFTHQNAQIVYVLAIIGLLLLLAASFNYINLSTALVNKRVKEIGVKKVIGASFQHVFFQLLIETGLISLFALVLAVGLAQLGMPFLRNITELPLQIDFRAPQIWGLLVGVATLSTLLAGIYPAALFAGFRPIRLIKGKLLSEKGVSLRKGLVVAQFATAIIFATSTFFIYQQLQFIQQKNVGYDRSYVLKIEKGFSNEDWRTAFAKFGRFGESLKDIPEFEGVAMTNGSLVQINSSTAGNLDWDGKPADESAPIFTLQADESLLSVFDLQMTDGRWFDKALASDKNNVIINEAAAATYDFPRPLVGSTIKFRGKSGKIIGVAKDFHFKSLHEKIDPLIISYNGEFKNTILAKVNGKTGPAALEKAQQQFATFFPDTPFDYTFLDDTFEKMHESEAKVTFLFQIFAGLLLFISCLGLFGLATFAVERRIKEIGIRKVLGANTQIIVRLLSKDFLQLIVLAMVIAAPIAWLITQNWLNNYAYHIEIQWWVFLVIGSGTLLLALLTVGTQGVKAALMNPAEVLKNE
ncbi:MAG: ABC transporter permease [Bacteroidota bacterium]